jgi:CheY-like chemotaxis protein
MGMREHGYLHVLVIDDDAELRDLISSFVVELGHQAIPVGSAEAGLEQLPYQTFDVALLDQRLPGMEGLVLGEYLHRNNPQMEVVLMTGDTDPRIARIARASGLRLLQKPFELEAIETILGRAIARERLRQQAETPAVSDPAAGGPIDLAAHYSVLSEAFAAPAVPHRVEELLARRVREALEAIRYGGGFDERARAIAYAGILAAQVLGVKLPSPRHHASMADWYDALMEATGRPRAFHAIEAEEVG